jgi:hypothetical protein
MQDMERNTAMIVARLEERFNGFEKLFEMIVTEQTRMATSYEALVKGQHRIDLVDAEIVSLKEGQKILWKKHDEMAAAHARRTETWLGEFIKWAAAIVLGASLSYFGIHPAGATSEAVSAEYGHEAQK